MANERGLLVALTEFCEWERRMYGDAQHAYEDDINAFLAARQSSTAPLFVEGDEVEKSTGDYQFEGVVVSEVHKRSGEVRYVVEDDRGLLLIMNGKQIHKRSSQTMPPGYPYAPCPKCGQKAAWDGPICASCYTKLSLATPPAPQAVGATGDVGPESCPGCTMPPAPQRFWRVEPDGVRDYRTWRVTAMGHREIALGPGHAYRVDAEQDGIKSGLEPWHGEEAKQ
jgi:hypothetical protein